MVYLKLGPRTSLFIDQKALIQIAEREVIAVNDAVLSSSVPLANAILAGKVVSATEGDYLAWLDSQNLPVPTPDPEPDPDPTPGNSGPVNLDDVIEGTAFKKLSTADYNRLIAIANSFEPTNPTNP